MNTLKIDIQEALRKYAEEYDFTPDEAAEEILSSFLIAGGFLKRPPVEDDDVMRSGKRYQTH